MSWLGNTLIPVITDVWFNTEPPAKVEEAAAQVRACGHSDIAEYISKLNDTEYENLVWQVVYQCQHNHQQQESSNDHETV